MASDRKTRIDRYLKLTEIIGSAPRVDRLSRQLNPEDLRRIPAEAADGLLDITAAAHTITTVWLPKLEQMELGDPAIEDVLDEIAEEYWHIFYHLTHTTLFEHIIER